MIAERGWWPYLPGLFAELAGCAPAAVLAMLAKAGVSLERAGTGGSALNRDGTPVEIAVSVTRGHRRLRVLMDPGHWEADPVRRSRCARAACERLAHELPPALEQRLLRGIGKAWPDDAAIVKWLPRGCLWLGATPGRPGVAAYLSARWGPPAERWPRVFEWLDSLGLVPGNTLAIAACCGEPASVSLLASRELHARVYYRLAGPFRLTDLALPAVDEAALARFLAAVVGERPIRRSGLLVSVSGVVAGREMVGGGRFSGCKVDICAHCAGRGPTEWAALTEQLAAELGLASPGLAHALLCGQAEMAFIGLGFPEAGATQLNCYLKAPLERRALAAARA